MSPAQALCALVDVPVSEGRRATLEDGTKVAIFRHGEGAVVMDEECTHNGAPMSEYGEIEGDVIECVWHGCKFDLLSGEAVGGPCNRNLRMHPCTIIDGNIVVRAK